MQVRDGGRRQGLSRRRALHLITGGLAATASFSAVETGKALAVPLPGVKPELETASGVPLPGTKPQWVEEGLSEEVRTIAFEHQWTGEKLKVPYYEHGHVLIDALAEIDHILRDSRNGQTHPTDPAMLDILVAMRQRLGTDAPFYVVCGYRSPETNEMLAEQGGGVAKNSYHMAGKAIDVRMPNRDTASMRAVALDLQAGGVGYYGRSDFLHIDSGPVRSWT